MNRTKKWISLTLKTLLLIIMAAATVLGTVTALSENDVIKTDGTLLHYLDMSRFYSQSAPPADVLPVVPANTTALSESDIQSEPEPDEQPGLLVSPPQVQPLSAEVQQRLDTIAKDYDCVGVQVAVIDRGYLSADYCYGYADVATGRRLDLNTKIRVASLTKVVIGMMAMRSQEDGYFDLDDPLSSLLGFRVRSPYYTKQTITMRSLLTHTSGINDTAAISGRSLEDFFRSRSTYFNAKPNTAEGWYYSNPGIRAAGGVMEVIANRPLYDYMDEAFFDPLEVDGSCFCGLLDDRENISTLYYGSKSVSQTVTDQLTRWFYETPGANSYIYAGGLTISADDYARVLCVLLRDGEYDGKQLLSPESVAEMQTVNYELSGFDQCVILRHTDDIYGGREIFYHTGNAYGVLALACYDEASGEGVVIVTNGSLSDAKDEHGIYNVCGEMAEVIFSDVLDGEL